MTAASANVRPRRPAAESTALRTFEWLLLIIGLAALDTYIWVNTSTLVSQAYEDWAFDEQLRGVPPSFDAFLREEMRTLRERARPKPAAPVAATEETKPAEPEALETKPLPPSAVIGRLEIPNLHLSVMVREGADTATLRKAIGHIPGTALPGRKGNIALAGHRDTFFRPLANIKANDVLELRTEDGLYRYSVESTKIVGPRDVSVLAPGRGNTLTLVTCYPFYYVGSAPKRFIVRANLLPGVEASKNPPPTQPHRSAAESPMRQ